MTNLIFCHKLQKQAPQLTTPPFPGPLGLEVFQNISEPAWQLWLAHQTMLINEYRLNLIDIQARDFLKQEMRKFLFTNESSPPPGFYEQENS